MAYHICCGCATINHRGESMDNVPKILVVDDDKELLKLIKEINRTYEWETAAITNPHEAMRLLKDERFDLLITDIRMPKSDGYKLIRRVRMRFPELPIMIITGYDTYKVHSFAKSMNIGKVLMKPVKIWEFAFAVADVLELEPFEL